MQFLELPIDVGILIYKYLDTKSKINLYNSCRALRVFFAPCHVRKIVLSRSTLAAAKTLNENLLMHLGEYIQDLNLYGVADLTPEPLEVFLRRLKHLKTLDITFTNVYLPELIEMWPDSLENLSVNFFKCPRKCKIDGTWESCKNIFKQKSLLYLHFIVFEFLDSDTPLIFLKDTLMVQELKITVADNYKDFWDVDDMSSMLEDDIDINFAELTYMFRDCRVTHKASKCLRGVSTLDYDKIEYIFIMYLERIVIFVSPLFSALFSVTCSDMQVEISSHLPHNFMLDGNILFKAWNKSVTDFNETFFKRLLEDLKDFFPTYVCMHKNIKMRLTNAVSNWYCIDFCDGFEKTLIDLPEKVTLTDFCRKDGTVIRRIHPIPNLSTGSKTLKNVTFMRLSNICIRKNVFTILLSECCKLNTLDIFVEKRGRVGVFRGYILSLSKSIHLAKYLKNIKLTSEDIEYEMLFDALSRCNTLENIHICEYERTLGDSAVDDNNVMPLIEKCENLYSLFIEADMSPEALTILISVLKTAAQKLEKDNIYIEVCDCYRGWNPFLDIFNPSPLHILD